LKWPATTNLTEKRAQSWRKIYIYQFHFGEKL